MSSFSQDMRQVVKELTGELGNKCLMFKPSPSSSYDPMTGETTGGVWTQYPTTSVLYDKFSIPWGSDGVNTNLSGIQGEKVIIPWFGKKVDITWRYNYNNITDVSYIESDNEILYFILAIGEKA